MPKVPRSRSLFQAFMSSTVGTGLSKLFGLIRELTLSSVFGAGMVYDAFIVAWTFPGIIRRFVADEGLTGALMPAIGRAETESEEEAKKLAGQAIVALLIACLVISGIGVLATPALVQLVADGFEGEKLALTISLTRFLFPFVFFVSVVSWIETLVNHRGHFFWPKVAPAAISVSVVGAALLMRSESDIDTIWAVSYATMVGGAVHVVICLPALVRLWGFVRPQFQGFDSPRFRRLLKEMGKVFLIGIAAKINILVLRFLASQLEEGSVTWYWNATRLVDFAQGIIAVGIGSALLPKIVDAVSDRDGDAFRTSFSEAAQLAGAILIPVAFFLAFFAEPFVAILLRHGNYSWGDVQQTAAALQLLTPFMLAIGGINIIKKPFFALDRRDVLLGVGVCGVFLTYFLGVWLCPMYGVNGLAAALSISTTIQLLVYMVVVRGLIEGGLGLTPLMIFFGKIALATVPAVGTGLLLVRFGDWEAGFGIKNVLLLSLIGLLGGIAYVVAALVLKIPEVQTIIAKFRRKLKI